MPGDTTPSGRFLLRVDPALHGELREAARRAGVSLNDFCARKLARPVTDVAGPGDAVVARAAAMFRERLQGVVVFGSWARDEAAVDSDVDVLVVIDQDVVITRDLYRSWDRQPLTWRARVVDVHFATAPESPEAAGGMWNDVAVDGAVLYDRDLKLSRTLAEIRSRVATGRLARHVAHGQRYWVEER